VFSGIDATDIGQRYIEHLASQGSSSPNFGNPYLLYFKDDFFKAAQLCPKVCGQDGQTLGRLSSLKEVVFKVQ